MLFCLSVSILIVAGFVSYRWLFLILPGLVLGLIFLGLGWLTHHSRWLHLRVRAEDTNIKLSLPLPFGWLAWGVKVARLFVPKLRKFVTDDVLVALGGAMSEGAFCLAVDEAGGEQVQIYYG